MAYNMKKVKGYLVVVLVFYTTLVTYFLALTAWNDDVTVTKPGSREEGLLNVLYQEEKRHIRSFKDVIKSYGGLVQPGVSKKSKRENNISDEVGSNSGQAGASLPIPRGTDFYVEDGNFNSSGINFTGVVMDEGARVGDMPVISNRRTFEVDVEPLDKYAEEKKVKLSDPRRKPNTRNIVIEENSFVNGSNTQKPYPAMGVGVGSSAKQSKPNQNGFKFGQSSNLGMSSKVKKNIGDNEKSKNSVNNDSTLTQYCDKIDAEEPHLCFTERITFSHRLHVNISTSHMSFKVLGDVYIYSAYLDTRRTPAVILLMTMSPKGRDAVKASGYWCSFSLPAVFNQRHYWNGRREPLTVKADQATQLKYYAASVGHNMKMQFYMMSCPVPEKHLPSLTQYDSSHFHIVVGDKDKPLLDAVQERISVNVINNLGIPRYPVASNPTQEKGSVDLQNYSKTHSNSSIDSINTKEMGRNGSTSSVSSNPPAPSPVADSIVSCVAPVLSSVGVIPLVEFLELTLLLGSQHIVLYMHHMTNDVKTVLALYRQRGLVTVLPWSIPNPTSIWANGRDFALNDCLYRTMHRYEYALFHDMDEFFVPRITPDLPSFINFLKSKGGLKPHKISDLVFNSAYFSPPSKLQAKNLASLAGYTKEVNKFSTLRSIHRTYFNQLHSLRIIRPVMAFRVGAGERKKSVFNISPRYAGVNHYSQCINSSSTALDSGKPSGGAAVSGASGVTKMKSTPVTVCTSTKVDMHLWRLKDRLIRQTKDNIRILNARRKP